MKPVAHLGLTAAGRAYTPLTALFVLVLLATHPAGHGVGLSAGLAFGALLTLHVIVFGAAAARTAAPPLLARAALMSGILACVAAAAAPAAPFATRIGEAGLFLTTSSAMALSLAVLVGRAPSLRDEDW